MIQQSSAAIHALFEHESQSGFVRIEVVLMHAMRTALLQPPIGAREVQG